MFCFDLIEKKKNNKKVNQKKLFGLRWRLHYQKQQATMMKSNFPLYRFEKEN